MLTCWNIARVIALAACAAAFSACDPSPTSPDMQIRFAPAANLGNCAAITGVFFTPTIVVVRDTPLASGVSFVGNPALVVTFSDSRFTSNTRATGLPQATSVGSFSVTGGYVIFSPTPFIPNLSTTSQQFNCQLTGNRLVLSNNDALFDFGSGRFERARVHMELDRK
jgi:hypothetical protein